jgi:hypothetical protein
MTDEQLLRDALARALHDQAPPAPSVTEMTARFRRRIAVERLAATGVVIVLFVLVVRAERRRR